MESKVTVADLREAVVTDNIAVKDEKGVEKHPSPKQGEPNNRQQSGNSGWFTITYEFCQLLDQTSQKTRT